MLDQIKALLENNPDITQWVIWESEFNGHQIYTSLGEQEAIRATDRRSWHIILMTPVSNPGGEPLLGQTEIEIVEGERDIASRISAGVAQAQLHGSPAYSLPGPDQEYPDFTNVDPEIRDNPWQTISRLKDELQEAVDKEANIEVASSEFFINFASNRLISSTGIDRTRESSKLTWDICLLYNDGKADTEFWEMKFRPGTRQIDVPGDIARYARYARDAAIAEVPRSGTCPVVLTGDNLFILLQYFMHHSNAAAKYNGSALFEPGKPILPSEPQGDTLSIFSNAIHPGGIRSYSFDSIGLPGKRVPIIQDGKLVNYWSSSQHAQYLGLDATGAFGNFEIPAGNCSWDDLFKSNDRVILVVQFSTFDPQPVAGNYLGEIRVGYEFRADGSVIPLRGGSVTGNVVQGMLNCQFCRERETFYGYYGPRGIRFEHAQVAGE